MSLTQKRLKENLHYNSDTGIFIWLKAKSGRALPGSRAGCIDYHGYRLIRFDYKLYKASRLAWLYVHGYFPENDIDHKNQVRSDDKLKNLREASRQCNLRNYGNPRNNTSTVRGVHWDNRRQKWRAVIRVNGFSKSMGYHIDFLEAVCHRLAAEQCLDWESCNLHSPAHQYVKMHI